jgi:hypothetical protein
MKSTLELLSEPADFDRVPSLPAGVVTARQAVIGHQFWSFGEFLNLRPEKSW